MKTETAFKIHQEFDEHLLKEWQKLFQSLKGSYNLSPEWCSIWFKHFGKKNRKLFIYTVWEQDELKLVAPFYLENKVLYLMGSNPDFYDEFNILSTSDEYLRELVEDILEKKLKVDFRLVNPENAFVKLFFKKIENERIFSKKIYYSTLKLEADSDFKFEKSFSYRIKRKITSSNNKFNKKMVFEFETKKDSGFFEEMLLWHKKKWILFRDKENEAFIKDLYENTDLLVLSRLSHEDEKSSISFQLSYRYFDRVSIMASSFDSKFDVISPSLLIHHHFFNEAFKQGISFIDFGVGVYSYKYNFTNSESVILSIKTDMPFFKKYAPVYLTLKELKTAAASLLM